VFEVAFAIGIEFAALANLLRADGGVGSERF
jgi:hypothetical protein